MYSPKVVIWSTSRLARSVHWGKSDQAKEKRTSPIKSHNIQSRFTVMMARLALSITSKVLTNQMKYRMAVITITGTGPDVVPSSLPPKARPPVKKVKPKMTKQVSANRSSFFTSQSMD